MKYYVYYELESVPSDVLMYIGFNTLEEARTGYQERVGNLHKDLKIVDENNNLIDFI